MKLPVCQAPLRIHPYPTEWLSDEAAKDWISRIVEAHATHELHLTDAERAAGMPVRTIGSPSRASSQINNPTQKGLTVHVPEEAELPDGGHEEHAGSMVANTFKEGVTYPFRDGNVVVLGPGVFAKEGGDVISWEGKNYYPYDETEVELPHYPRPAVNGGSLIGPGVLINQAGNLIHYNGETFVPEPTSKEILARRDMQQRRLDMLRIALDVKEISPTDHRTVTQVADDLLKWWLKEEEK